MSRRLSRLRDQTGQDLVEYAGVVVIVAIIVGAVVIAITQGGLGSALVDDITHDVSAVLGESAAPGTSSPAPLTPIERRALQHELRHLRTIAKGSSCDFLCGLKHVVEQFNPLGGGGDGCDDPGDGGGGGEPEPIPIEGAIVPGCEPGEGDDPPASGEPSQVGAQRILRMVRYFGDRVVAVEQKVTVPGLGSTDVDVELDDGSYCEVGGPAKAANPSKFGRQLQILQAYAESQGGTAKFFYAEGTPQSAIDQAIRRLGPENVQPIP